MKTLHRRVPALFGMLVFFGTTYAQSNLEVIRSHFKSQSPGLSIEMMSEAPSKSPGVTHCYVRQLLNGIPVVNSVATVTVKGGRVIHMASRLKTSAAGNHAADATTPALTPLQAIEKVAASLGLTYSGVPRQLKADASGQRFLFDAGTLSQVNIPVQLVYVAGADNQLQLAWDLSIATVDGNSWWSVRASATDGTIIDRNDWIVHCDFDHCASTEQHAAHAMPMAPPPPPPGTDQYLVYALPVESPNHGNRSVVTGPSDAVFSPYGWHDTDGVDGPEYTITRGNNVYASDDINDDDLPGYSPDGLAAMNYSFPFDSLLGVQGNLDAVVTNLFYMNNMMHDVWAHYGFDEASGNFQESNYSGEGLDFDAVMADAQDGSGTNNANFGTPPDGESPRMQMYLWSEANADDLLTVNSPASVAGPYVCSTAGFGPPVPTTPITQDFVLVNDGVGDVNDGCETIINSADLAGKIAVFRRGSCTFASKVEAAESFGALAAIIMNNTGGAPTTMGGTSTTNIPSVMISQTDGNDLVAVITNGETVNGTLGTATDLTATDSDFDNVVIAHEYGHGISTRLTGGAASADCLFNSEQMGEGWSDWFGLMLTMEPGDLAADRRGVATYLSNQPTTGTGIRPAPYSTSFTINNYKYGATNNSGSISEPHGIGFVWASMLWDLTWAMIDEYGFDPNIKTGTGGNNKAMALVIEGLKMQPCSPGFVDGRDAILAADEVLFDGANQCLIWRVFARRGLGFSADQGSSESRVDQTEAFDLPAFCSIGLAENGLSLVSIYPNPTEGLLNIDMSVYSQVKSVRIFDLQGKLLFETTELKSPVLTVDLSAYRSGVYMVQLTDVNGTEATQIVKH